MPVTQPRPDVKLLADVFGKASKPSKNALKLHALGFYSPFFKENIKRERQTSEKRSSKAAKRAPRVFHNAPYTHTDVFSTFFAGSKAALGTETVPSLNNTFLRPNARFVGDQQSGSLRYDIKVEIKTVDLVSSVVTGFFQISGLTDEHPLITTCFKGEIINNPLHRTEWGCAAARPKRYLFVTEEHNWSSFPRNDLEHWKKLTGCAGNYLEAALCEKLRKIQLGEQDSQYIYMRWKEEFLLPDSRVKLLSGASFEGFYYVVLNIGSRDSQDNNERSVSAIAPGTMSGLYFYKQSEKFQSLSLRYVEDRGQSSTFEFA